MWEKNEMDFSFAEIRKNMWTNKFNGIKIHWWKWSISKVMDATEKKVMDANKILQACGVWVSGEMSFDYCIFNISNNRANIILNHKTDKR